MEAFNNTPFIGPMLTDGGLETELVYKHGLQLPHFAAFAILQDPKGTDIVLNYYRKFLDLAKQYSTGFVLEAPTWRANPDWAFKLGYSEKELEEINLNCIGLMNSLKDEYADSIDQIWVSGNIGPRADGYVVDESLMSAKEAENYHLGQIKSFKKADVDQVTAMTINYLDEALGIVQAAKKCGVPVVISFTTETDGKLPSGEKLQDVIEYIDLQTGFYPKYYMVNCAHPTHFVEQLGSPAKWSERIMGIRANASCKSHEELDNSEELDSGDREELSNWYVQLREILPNLAVYGGCCGTDHTHIEAICGKLLKHEAYG
ncbi:homocysteine S-methyltransferase family protein [Flagellimonas myxillae]|uniref:homocysteine S-methyltransferase family protein n=1 Tax=Flagellimonas myxillae TaxID=2942214 RepID=UPI00201FAA81|nr:homocysteine S-methyltransferase family protein [Muricauda myxillae]MCL6266080.1 homocysteine S-methyltransferase family protein [Muricauda myxillae]